MAERGCHPRLGLEPASEGFVGSEARMQHFDGDPPAQVDIFGHKHVG